MSLMHGKKRHPATVLFSLAAISALAPVSACAQGAHTHMGASDHNGGASSEVDNYPAFPEISTAIIDKEGKVSIYNPQTKTFELGKADAKRADIFVDPLCPICQEFINSPGGARFFQLITAGKARATFHVANFLERGTGSHDYDDRVISALIAIAQSSLSVKDQTIAFLAAEHALYATGVQPEEGGDKDHTNQELGDIISTATRLAGVTLPDDVVAKIKSGAHVAEAKASAAAVIQELKNQKIQGVPSLRVDNKLYGIDDDTPAESITNTTIFDTLFGT